jgi:hypothetical protein
MKQRTGFTGFFAAKADEVLTLQLLTRTALLSVAMPSNFTMSQLCTNLTGIKAISPCKSKH